MRIWSIPAPCNCFSSHRIDCIINGRIRNNFKINVRSLMVIMSGWSQLWSHLKLLSRFIINCRCLSCGDPLIWEIAKQISNVRQKSFLDWSFATYLRASECPICSSATNQCRHESLEGKLVMHDEETLQSCDNFLFNVSIVSRMTNWNIHIESSRKNRSTHLNSGNFRVVDMQFSMVRKLRDFSCQQDIRDASDLLSPLRVVVGELSVTTSNDIIGCSSPFKRQQRNCSTTIAVLFVLFIFINLHFAWAPSINTIKLLAKLKKLLNSRGKNSPSNYINLWVRDLSWVWLWSGSHSKSIQCIAFVDVAKRLFHPLCAMWRYVGWLDCKLFVAVLDLVPGLHELLWECEKARKVFALTSIMRFYWQEVLREVERKLNVYTSLSFDSAEIRKSAKLHASLHSLFVCPSWSWLNSFALCNLMPGRCLMCTARVVTLN